MVTTPSPFWTRVNRRGPDECWPWTGATSDYGYGRLHRDGRMLYAHRLAWALAHGQTMPPRPLVVMHTCDNPPCCNPRHLRVGTYRDNVLDAQAKGRMPRARPVQRLPRRPTRPRERACAHGHALDSACPWCLWAG